jgi:hypothetical protein
MWCANVLKLLFLKLGEEAHLTALAVQALGKSLPDLSLVGSSSQASNRNHHHRRSNLRNSSCLTYRATNLLINNPHLSLCSNTNNKVLYLRLEFNIAFIQNFVIFSGTESSLLT